MKEKLYMGVDLGTSFIKTGVYSLDGRLHAGWSEPVKDERPAPGVFLQHGEELYRAVCSCIVHTTESLGQRAGSIEAIAFTGQMAGSMGVDEDWNDVTTWSCTLDGRYFPYADRQREQFGRELFEIGGTNAPVMCAKYAWFKEAFPEKHKRIAKYVMLNGYIIGKMSNIPVDEAKIDYSLITWTGLSDIRTRQWSQQICRDLEVDSFILPQIVSCTAIGGYLSGETAKQLGLPAGIPLVAGAGDKVSGCTGAAVFDDGDLIFEAASYGAVSCRVPEVRLDLERRNYDIIGSIDAESYYAHKYIQGSGITIDWFVENFLQETGTDKKEAFKKAEELAEKIGPGSEKLISIGLLGGSAMPFDSEMKGLFMGHTWNHGKGHFYHALLEGFSYDLALTLDSLKKQYPEYTGKQIKLIGGGAKSTIWPQMLADVTGCEFARLGRRDAALWGAAILAAAGAGEVKDIKALAKEHAEVKTLFRPDKEKHRQYKPYIKLYESFTQKLHPLYTQLNTQ